MEIIILASGSKGNAISIITDQNKILVDIGISYLSANNKLKDNNLKISKYDTLLITHEHSDHIRGLRTLLRKNTIKNVYLTKGTFNSLSKELRGLLPVNTNIITADIPFSIENLLITPFQLSHDASEPVGYIIEKDVKKVVILIDTGYVDESYHETLSGANLYVLEANHDPELLMKSRRPFYLKRRIVSEQGHLSNYEAAWLFNKFTKESTHKTKWAVAHISEDCNSKEKIKNAIDKLVDFDTEFDLIFTSQETSKKIIL